jgi:hypothetical protein
MFRIGIAFYFASCDEKKQFKGIASLRADESRRINNTHHSTHSSLRANEVCVAIQKNIKSLNYVYNCKFSFFIIASR